MLQYSRNQGWSRRPRPKAGCRKQKKHPQATAKINSSQVKISCLLHLFISILKGTNILDQKLVELKIRNTIQFLYQDFISYQNIKTIYHGNRSRFLNTKLLPKIHALQILHFTLKRGISILVSNYTCNICSFHYGFLCTFFALYHDHFLLIVITVQVISRQRKQIKYVEDVQFDINLNINQNQ